MKKDLADHVMEIIDAEQRCGHHMLYDGTEDIADRYSAILNMLIQIMEGREEGVVSFHNMRETKKLSPEALALILEYQDLDEHDLRWWIEDELEKSNYMDALIFRGMLGKTTSAKRAANREHIRRVVRAQQSRNRNAEHAFTGKGAVYTVITGGYDRLLDPLVLNKEWDYFCITDNEAMESKVWKVIPYPDDDSLDAARKNRKAKLLPWEFLDGYDYSLYIDGNIQITGDLTEWINWYAGKSGMLCFPHGVSNGLSDELELIQQHREKYYDDARRQAENYLSEGYPDNYPMVVASILLRDHHDPLLKKTMEDWWNEVLTKSGRDQISFGYANWKNGFVYDLCELDIYDNPYFSVKSHR